MGCPGVQLGLVAVHYASGCQQFQRRAMGFWSDLLSARFAIFPTRRRVSGEPLVLWGSERTLRVREG